MPKYLWNDLVDQLRGVTYQVGLIEAGTPTFRVQFEEGLTDAEIRSAEERFEFRFPPDLRGFLQTALPVGREFPNWRSPDEHAMREWLDRHRSFNHAIVRAR